MMKTILSTSLLANVLLVLPVGAQQVYKCVDAEEHVTYSNVVKPGSKNCNPITLEPESVLPAPARPRAASNPTPANFPSVSSAEQSARDNDSRVILAQELEREQKALEQARKELEEQRARNPGDMKDPKILDRLQPYEERVAQHERNIQALNKEIGNQR
ncbi:MAG: DUF4124 domain-containing protein [Zoogloeaceae bacterium]|jgi:hypothetical protein|nr:DUF4124 domain-containing protein [Zoogloeaceae bacterium]